MRMNFFRQLAEFYKFNSVYAAEIFDRSGYSKTAAIKGQRVQIVLTAIGVARIYNGGVLAS